MTGPAIPARTLRRRMVVLLCMAGVASAAGGCRERIGHGWDWNRMRVQARYQAYGPSAVFADGNAMQLRPPGTVAREDAEVTGPRSFADSAAQLSRGAERFQIFCAACHGVRGGGESIVASNMDPPRPPSLLVPPATVLTAAQIAAVITAGFGPMPSFAGAVSPADRRAISEYLKSLQHAAPATSAFANGSTSSMKPGSQ